MSLRPYYAGGVGAVAILAVIARRWVMYWVEIARALPTSAAQKGAAA